MAQFCIVNISNLIAVDFEEEWISVNATLFQTKMLMFASEMFGLTTPRLSYLGFVLLLTHCLWDAQCIVTLVIG